MTERRRTGTEVEFTRDPNKARGSRYGLWWSYGDPDEAWATINHNKGNK